ncbi:hypothetical protein D9M69_687490 [compost metagenome]
MGRGSGFGFGDLPPGSVCSGRVANTALAFLAGLWAFFPAGWCWRGFDAFTRLRRSAAWCVVRRLAAACR